MNTLKTKSSRTNAIKYMTMAAVLATTMLTGIFAAPAAALADNDRGKGYQKEHVAHSGADHRMHNKAHKRVHKKAHDVHANRPHKNHHKYKERRDRHAHDKYRWHSHGGHSHRHDTKVVRSYHQHDHAYKHHHGYDPRISLGLHLGHFDLYFEDY